MDRRAEIDGRDQLVSVALDGCDQTPELLHQPEDFAGYACLSPDGRQLAWWNGNNRRCPGTAVSSAAPS